MTLAVKFYKIEEAANKKQRAYEEMVLEVEESREKRLKEHLETAVENINSFNLKLRAHMDGEKISWIDSVERVDDIQFEMCKKEQLILKQREDLRIDRLQRIREYEKRVKHSRGNLMLEIKNQEMQDKNKLDISQGRAEPKRSLRNRERKKIIYFEDTDDSE